MGAECDKCGADLVYAEWPIGECPVCPLEEKLARFERLTELAHDWRNSDEWIGNVFRAIVGREPPKSTPPAACLPPEEEK